MAELREREESSFENILLTPTVRKGGTCPGGTDDPPTIIEPLPANAKRTSERDS
jgi:hypothetical protein